MINKKNHIVVVGLGLNGSCIVNELVKKKFNVTAIDSFDFLDDKILNKNWLITDFKKIKTTLLLVKNFIFHLSLSYLKDPLLYRVGSLIQPKNQNIISVNNTFNSYFVNKIGGKSHLWGRVSPRYPEKEFDKSKQWPFKYIEIKKIYKELENKFLLNKKKKFNNIEKSFLTLVKKKWKNRKAMVLPTLNYKPGSLNPMLKEIIKNKIFQLFKTRS
jgi:hypothetical protein